MLDISQASSEDRSNAIVLARKVVEWAREQEIQLDMLTVSMDLTAAAMLHGLDLERMISDWDAGKHSDVTHDVGGLFRHLDRVTGELKDCFLPRYARS